MGEGSEETKMAMMYKAFCKNLKERGDGFRILRGDICHERRRIFLWIVKVKKPRTGILSAFIRGWWERGYSIVIINPTTPAMFGFLDKMDFEAIELSIEGGLYCYPDIRAWIKEY